MKTEEKHICHNEAAGRIIDEMIQEYISGYSLNLGNEENYLENTSEYFSIKNDSNQNTREVKNDSNLSKEQALERVNALLLAQKLIMQENDKIETENTIENNNKVRYSILDVLELDRKRIARDLHDSSVQILTMLVHKAELCEKLIEIDTIRTKMELHIMSDVLKDAISELRQTIFNLRPMTMDDLGIMDSIERYVQMLIQSSDIIFKLNVINSEKYDIEQLLKPVQKLSLYRVLQECCSNIVKHSGARNALITIKLHADRIEMVVEDDGKGFNNPGIINRVNEISNSKSLEEEECLDALTKVLSERSDFSGYGLSMLQERVYLLRGKMHIDTSKKGSRIKVIIPITTYEEVLNETN